MTRLSEISLYPVRSGLSWVVAFLVLSLHAAVVNGSDRVVLQLAWRHQFQFAGYYAALHKGFYREAGLDVAIVEGGEGRFAREAVLGGHAQYGVAGAELLLHRAEGNPFVVLAAIFQHSASIILSRGDSNIAHPQDLIGKRLMILPENKDADILAVFQNEGIPIRLIHRMDPSYNLNDLIEGRTDAVSAYITNEPWHLEQAGIAPGIILPQTYGVDFYSDCLFTTEEEIEKNPDRVNRFRAASLRGWGYAMDHQEEIIDLLIERYGVAKDRGHLRYEARAMENLIFPKLVEIGHMNPGRWRHIADTFSRLGALPEHFDLKGFIFDPDPKPEVKKLKFALFTLIAGIFCTSFIIFLFVRMNRKLKAEVLERKKTENSLRESESRLRTIFDASQAGIILVDPQGVITFANQGMAEMFGGTLQDLIGSAYPEHVHPDQRSLGDRKMRQLIDGGIDSVASERRYVRLDGTDFWGFLSGRRHEDDEGNLISLVGIIADITEQKEMEHELRQAHKMESIGTLTGGVAHDFNNILGVIIGNAELAIDDVPESSPAHANLQSIKSAGLKAAGIVRQLLDFSRKTGQELNPLDVVPVIRDSITLLRSTIPATIDIQSRLPETEIVILADPIQINQVLLNICTNASQAMEKTGGVLSIVVEATVLGTDRAKNLSGLPPGGYVEITVSDTGPGIAPAVVDRIFDPYYTTKEIGKGSGMGLSVVLGIVKSHGGGITVDSRPGDGATFTLLFPMCAGRPTAAAEERDDVLTGRETILFVDDETFIAEMAEDMLKRLGYRVETTSTPVEALKRFQEAPHEFDLVITDMTMPQMTGLMLFERLTEIREDIPVIISTGYSALIDEQKAAESGVAAFVMKPFVVRDMAKTIRSVLDKIEGMR